MGWKGWLGGGGGGAGDKCYCKVNVRFLSVSGPEQEGEIRKK